MSILFELFYTFLKIGLFTFGGGYAMISIIEDKCIRKKKWITHDELMHLTIIAESTPGPIAINCATFVGYKKKGLPGAIVSTLGITIPSFCIILLISTFLDNFLEIRWVANAFQGIKVAVGILILDAAFKMLKKMKKSFLPMAIMIISTVLMTITTLTSVQISSIILMIIAALINLIVFAVSSKKESEV